MRRFGPAIDGDEARLCDYANHAEESLSYSWKNTRCNDGVGERTTEVGRYKANAFGLHDMHGNVWEWVEDCWHSSYQDLPTDGSEWTTACSENARVLRGGSWNSGPRILRSVNRGKDLPSKRFNAFGFRVARTVAP